MIFEGVTDIFKASVIDVQDGEFKAIVCLGYRYDYGLKKEVETSVNIIINDDHKGLMLEYKKLVGKTVLLPVNVFVSKKGGILRSTTGTGLPLPIEVK